MMNFPEIKMLNPENLDTARPKISGVPVASGLGQVCSPNWMNFRRIFKIHPFCGECMYCPRFSGLFLGLAVGSLLTTVWLTCNAQRLSYHAFNLLTGDSYHALNLSTRESVMNV